MGKCNSNNQFLTITLSKKVVSTLDEVIKVLNREKETSRRITRSTFINDVLSTFMFEVGEEVKAKQSKKGENNNA